MSVADEQFLDLIVLVSGEPVPVRVNVNETLDHVVREALRETGNAGQPPENWELRLADGTPLDLSIRSGDAGLVDGTTLTLQPRAAAGG